jgi:hypothetical protein
VGSVMDCDLDTRRNRSTPLKNLLNRVTCTSGRLPRRTAFRPLHRARGI